MTNPIIKPNIAANITIVIFFDLSIIELSNLKNPDLRPFATSYGDINICNLEDSYPYVEISDSIQEEVMTITNLTERQEVYYEWQNLIADKM